MRQLILASSSPFRRQLLERLRLPFTAAAPRIDESLLSGESPRELVLRLSEAKARALADQYPDALIIGSDQVAVLDREILGKPGNRENAVTQLKKCSNNIVIFHTGLCLLDAGTNHVQRDVVACEVRFRPLSFEQIERYVDIEQPYQSAGSFKAESLGITLFEYLRGDDPNALIGLPLIRLTDMLQTAGIELP